MNDPAEHDFDWVTARDRCSLRIEFHHLKRLVSESRHTRRRCAPEPHPYEYEFCEDGGDSFSIRRTEKSSGDQRVVEFARRNGCIDVGGSDTDTPWRMKLTLTLNDAGACRFRIDGRGEYLRWQVARRALGNLFFDDAREE